MDAARYSPTPITFHRTAPSAGDTPSAAAGRRPRKAFTRRRGDRSQLIRRTFQWAFILLNLWIGVRFYAFVRYYETAGATLPVSRPPGVEGWLPIAALMNLKYVLVTGIMPVLHPAGLVLLVAFLAMTLAFRKAFCSWLCPIGTISEWLWQGGRELFGRNVSVPRWLDIPLRSLKYILLGLFAWVIVRMSAAEILAFMESPYGVIADVKMLNFFRHLGQTGAIVIAVLVGLSVFVKNAWCRFLCPYGAMLGLVALVSPTRIRRNPDACIDCAKCAKACPSLLPVDKLITVKSAECTSCLECVAVCPAQGALDLTTAGWRVPARLLAAGLAAIFLGFVAAAMLTGHWHTIVPESLYFDLIPRASTLGHPGV